MRLGFLTIPIISLAIANGSAEAATTGVTGNGDPVSRVGPSLTLSPYIRQSGNGSGDVGEVRWFAGDFSDYAQNSDANFLEADGRLLPITGNEDLFGRISTTYGGDGTTTFALPDLRGRAAVGASSTRALGTLDGVSTLTLTEANMPKHFHTLAEKPSQWDGTETGATGASSPDAFTNRQPSVALNYEIATQGIFPSPSEISGPGTEPTDSETNLGFIRQTAATSGAVGWHGLSNPADQAISQNTALFSLLGTTFGGDGETTFGLPDMADRLPIGEGTGPGLTFARLGAVKGSETTTLTTATLPSHDHSMPGTSDRTGSTGGSQQIGDREPSLVVNHIIALLGVFPSRNTLDFGQNDGEPTLGEVTMFGGNFAPRGWAFADGQILEISQFTALFSLLGTDYGGDGETTFALPDLRGRTMIGQSFGGLSALPSMASVGASGGSEFTTLTASQLPEHAHTFAPPVPLPAPILMLMTALTGLAGVRLRAQRRAQS